MATRDELVRAVAERYGSSGRAEKTAILDEFTAVTGFHRKHAVRLLRGNGDPPTRRRPRPPVYGEAARETMLILWEASDRVCGKRLRAMVPLLVVGEVTSYSSEFQVADTLITLLDRVSEGVKPVIRKGC